MNNDLISYDKLEELYQQIQFEPKIYSTTITFWKEDLKVYAKEEEPYDNGFEEFRQWANAVRDEYRAEWKLGKHGIKPENYTTRKFIEQRYGK